MRVVSVFSGAIALAGLALSAGLAAAAGPRVVADIAPVHSLVARVMEGTGEPDLLLPPGVSPHGYALRPSDARALDRAEVVIWVGPALTPWLGETLVTLAGDSVSVELGAASGVLLLPARAGGGFEPHDHDHAQGHDHADEAAQGHGRAGRDAQENRHAHDDGEGQRHGAGEAADHADGAAQQHEHAELTANGARYDPHIWLDPRNAAAWFAVIAEALAAADPANAAAYRANAEAGRAELSALEREIHNQVAPVRDRPFIVFHDAYQYFEAHFGVSAVGAVSLGDASRPSAARVAEVRDLIRDSGAVCIFAEPQFEPQLLETVIEGTDVRKGVLDPVGTGLTPGVTLYPELLLGLSRDLVACLSGKG